MTASARQVLRRGPVEHLVFSDGLASVSVFIERARSQAGPRNADAAARLGVSSAYSTAVEGYRVTAVGEVPPDTVRAIALSIRTAGPAPSLAESAAEAGEAAAEEGEAEGLPSPQAPPAPDRALLAVFDRLRFASDQLERILRDGRRRGRRKGRQYVWSRRRWRDGRGTRVLRQRDARKQ